MTLFPECPLCGGEMVEKEVEKLLKGGVNMASCLVNAEVCLHCGERLYAVETIQKFEEIIGKLEKQETEEFNLMGRSFRVA